MNRREARKQAFLLLFQYKFQPDCIDELLEDFFCENNAGKERAYIENTVKGTVAEIERIDSIIDENSKGWRLDRISSVSLAAIRLGVYEMLYVPDIPSVVSVNEAVALAKEFDGDEAAPFVNGILDKIKDSLL